MTARPGPTSRDDGRAADPGLLLALDTSTNQAGIALYDGGVRAELLWQAGRDHGRHLLASVRYLLERVDRGPGDLTSLAVARGPGSFTGLRVGLAVARGLAFALGIPLYGIGSLDVVASGVAATEWPVWAVLDAGRGRFACARFEWEGQTTRQASDIVGVDLDGLLRLVRGPCAIAGELPDEARRRLAERTDQVWVASPAISARRPAVLAEIGWRLYERGARPDPAEGEPIYLTRA